ncbi:MAG: large-conductance mechanosensitive channel protein MscL [Oscillospiraceae bacterium]|nr:large-conductance mechanosensitive channel protein MscL [Oscillospiraceae bacterium]
MPKIKKTQKEKKKRGIIKEFKEFISRGSVMDLAMGIIIGSSFTAIVNSVVKDIITPVIGILIGGIDFSALKITLPSFFPDSEPPVFSYGEFIQSVINFFIIAVCVFAIIKFMNTLKSRLEQEKAEEALTEPAEPVEPEKAAEILLLEEIRDLLQKGYKFENHT